MGRIKRAGRIRKSGFGAFRWITIFIIELHRGTSAEAGEKPGLKKLRYLHSDESGLLTLSNLVVVLIILTMTCYIGNVVYETKQKMEIQNAADSVAYSSSVWMARGMNAITTTNHLVGELSALCIIHDAIAGPEADHYEKWALTKEHEDMNKIIRPLRITAPITDKSPFSAAYFTKTAREGFDKDFTCYVTRVMMKNYFPLGKRENHLVSAATIYDAKVTLKKKSVNYLIAKTGANALYFVPPWIGWVPAGYISAGVAYGIHFYCDYNLLQLLSEWHTLDTIGYVSDKMSGLKKPIETKLIPLLAGYSHFVATGSVQLPSKKAKTKIKVRSPLQNAIRSTGQVLKQKMGVEITTFPPPSELYLPVSREPSPRLNNLSAKSIWGDSVPNDLSAEFLNKLEQQLKDLKKNDPHEKARKERKRIVEDLKKSHYGFEREISKAKKSNDDIKADQKKLKDDEELKEAQKEELNEGIADKNDEVGGLLKEAGKLAEARDKSINELYEAVSPQQPVNAPPPGIDFANLSKEQAKAIKGKAIDVLDDAISNIGFGGLGCDDGNNSNEQIFDPNQVSIESFMDVEQLTKERDALQQDHRDANAVLQDMKSKASMANDSNNNDDPENDKPEKKEQENENDKQIAVLEKNRLNSVQTLERAVQKMMEKLTKLNQQIEKTKNKPDIQGELAKISGVNPSYDNLILVKGFDVETEKYSQLGRAVYPYVEGYRAPFLKQFKNSSPVSLNSITNLFKGNFGDIIGLKESEAAKHFVKWTNRYALVKVYQVRSGHRWTTKGKPSGLGSSSMPKAPSLVFYDDPKLKEVFLYQMENKKNVAPTERFKIKGTEVWTGHNATSKSKIRKAKQEAENRFSVIGFAYRKPHQPFFYKALFHSPNSKGKICFAQSMFYNGNAQIPDVNNQPGKIQPAVGWDTLNWKDYEDGNSWKSLAPEFPSGMPSTWSTSATADSNRRIWDLFRPSKDFSHKVCKTNVNWQSKLSPVTRRRLGQAANEVKNFLEFDGNYRVLVNFVIRSNNAQLINH